MIPIKMSKIIGILHMLKYTFPKEILLTIELLSLIVPHLNYVFFLWGVRHISCSEENYTVSHA